MRGMLVVGLLGLVVLSAGCASRSVKDEPVRVELAAMSGDETTSVPLAVPIGIDVESFAGNVTIEVNPKLREAEVRVRREGVHGYGRQKEAKASLGDISSTVDLVSGEAGETLVVRTSTTNAEAHFQRAHVHIKVPGTRSVRVVTNRGDVQCSGVGGWMDISTNLGDVKVMTLEPITEAVTILNREGDIDFRIRGESTGILDLHAFGGKVFYRVLQGRVYVYRGTDSDTVKAKLNDGANPIVMRTTDGKIRLAVRNDPMETGWMIIDP